MMLTPPMSHWHFHSTVDADFTFVDSKETEKITESKFESGRITFSPVKDSFAKNFHSVSFQVCVARGLFAVAPGGYAPEERVSPLRCAPPVALSGISSTSSSSRGSLVQAVC